MKQNKDKIKSFDGVIKISSSKKDESLSSSWFTNSLKSSGLKLFVVSALSVCVMAGLSSVGSTISYFSDQEVSIGNRLVADPLSFRVEIGSSTSAQVDLSQGEVMIVPVMTPDLDSELIQYFVKTEYTGGNIDLCNAVHVMGTWPFPYDGKLSSLYTATSTATGSWALTLSVPDPSVFGNTSCTVDLVYRGWNAGVNFGRGYNDVQKFSMTLYIPEIKQEVKTETVTQSFTGESNPSDVKEEIKDIPPESKSEEISDKDEKSNTETASEPKPEVVPKQLPEPVIESVTEENPKVEETVVENVNPPVESSTTDTKTTE